MKHSSRIATIGLLAGAFTAAPVAIAQGPGWTVKSTVIRLADTANGGVNARLSPDLGDCVSQSGYRPSYASILPNHLALNRMKSDLLFVFASGAPVLYSSDANRTVGEMALEGC